VHTLKLALKNISAPKCSPQNDVTHNECQWIVQVADEASLIHIFIMNHSMRLGNFNVFSPLKLHVVVET